MKPIDLDHAARPQIILRQGLPARKRSRPTGAELGALRTICEALRGDEGGLDAAREVIDALDGAYRREQRARAALAFALNAILALRDPALRGIARRAVHLQDCERCTTEALERSLDEVTSDVLAELGQP